MNLNMPADKSDFKNTNYTHTRGIHHLENLKVFSGCHWI